ncbi:MAG: FtsX-like permease family protein [Marinilabiliaceae bacterium]|nr:FtsX-like permease family protein [Marinilabiliaceae bacterium]
MNLALHIAKRYLIAKKSQNIINVISMISVVGVVTGSMALLVVLSVFNGLNGFIGDLFGAFDPDYKVVPVSGKVFSLDSLDVKALKDTEGVLFISEILEDQALLKFGKRRMPGQVMGVDCYFKQVSGVDSIMVNGPFRLHEKGENQGVLGAMLADQLNVRLNFVSPLAMYVPRRTGSINMMRPESSFNTEYIRPAGFFAVRQNEYDGKYVIVQIDQARKLFDYDSTMVSSLAIKVDPNIDGERLQHDLQKVAGPGVKVLNKEQQHEAFYKMMKVEKLMAFLILSFIMVIAAFNVIGTLSMLIYEKKESIFTLKSMGADRKLVTRIFLIEGWLISLVGVFVGVLVGVLLVWVQQYFGVIKFQGGGTYLMPAYPVKLQLMDVLLVVATVSIIGFLAAWYPVRVIVKRYFSSVGL